jgi:hypothetical protein
MNRTGESSPSLRSRHGSLVRVFTVSGWTEAWDRASDSPEDTRLLVMTAIAIFGGAAVVGLVEGFVPGTPHFPITPGVIALGMTAFLLVFGHRVPRAFLSVLGPIGVGLIAYALAETRAYGTERRSTPGQCFGPPTSTIEGRRRW